MRRASRAFAPTRGSTSTRSRTLVDVPYLHSSQAGRQATHKKPSGVHLLSDPAAHDSRRPQLSISPPHTLFELLLLVPTSFPPSRLPSRLPSFLPSSAGEREARLDRSVSGLEGCHGCDEQPTFLRDAVRREFEGRCGAATLCSGVVAVAAACCWCWCFSVPSSLWHTIHPKH